MARPLRGLRDFRKRRAANPPIQGRQPTVDMRPDAPGTGDEGGGENGGQAPSSVSPAPRGVPPAGSAWPGAAPAVVPTPPASPPAPGAARSPAARIPTAAGPATPAAAPPPRRPAAGDTASAPRAQLKSIRRWQMVTAAWATAATVIAVLAFLAANNDNEQHLADSAAQVRTVQRNVNQRLTRIQQQLRSVPQTDTVAELQKQVARLGRVALRKDKATGVLQRANVAVSKRVQALEQEVTALKSSQNSGAGTKTTP
jgi:hypothetical protein